MTDTIRVLGVRQGSSNLSVQLTLPASLNHLGQYISLRSSPTGIKALKLVEI